MRRLVCSLLPPFLSPLLQLQRCRPGTHSSQAGPRPAFVGVGSLVDSSFFYGPCCVVGGDAAEARPCLVLLVGAGMAIARKVVVTVDGGVNSTCKALAHAASRRDLPLRFACSPTASSIALLLFQPCSSVPALAIQFLDHLPGGPRRTLPREFQSCPPLRRSATHTPRDAMGSSLAGHPPVTGLQLAAVLQPNIACTFVIAHASGPASAPPPPLPPSRASSPRPLQSTPSSAAVPESGHLPHEPLQLGPVPLQLRVLALQRHLPAQLGCKVTRA